MALMGGPSSSELLLFGDQTDGFFAPIKQLYDQAANDAFLCKFLQDAATVLRRELSSLEPRMRDSMGGSFSDLLQLAERFRSQDDVVGLAHAVLVGIVRAAKLVQFVLTHLINVRTMANQGGLGLPRRIPGC